MANKRVLPIDQWYSSSLDGETLLEDDVTLNETIDHIFDKESDEVREAILQLIDAYLLERSGISSEKRKQLIRKMKRREDPEYQILEYPQPNKEDLYKAIHNLCKHTGIIFIRSQLNSLLNSK